MPPDISNLRGTIVPKSDQLNAEQLLGGPLTITVTDVRLGTEDQPVAIHYVGEEGRPFKPCKTMRKVLIFAWGEDGREWIGKSMTLYNDPAVRFGGMTVGGIRISHMSDIEREISVALTATKGKKAVHTIQKLAVSAALTQALEAIAAAGNRDTMAAAKKMVQQLEGPDLEAGQRAYVNRVQALKNTAASQADPATGETTPPPSKEEAKPEANGPTYAALYDKLQAAPGASEAAEVLDLGRHLPDDQRTDLAAAFAERFPD